MQYSANTSAKLPGHGVKTLLEYSTLVEEGPVRRNVRARGSVSAEVGYAGTAGVHSSDGSQRRPLRRQRHRQCSARNGDGVVSGCAQLLALSILQSFEHENLPRSEGKSELLLGTISGMNCGPLLSTKSTRLVEKGKVAPRIAGRSEIHAAGSAPSESSY